MEFLIDFFFFVLGLIVGSFLNVVILRLDTDEGIVIKRSHCPKCGHILRWYDLVPVLSFFVLGRRCRYCGQKISWQYPAVEMATGILFVLTFISILSTYAVDGIVSTSSAVAFIYLLFIVACLIVIFVYDLRRYLISDKIIYPAIAISIVFRFFETLNFNIGNFLVIAHWSLEIFASYFLSALGAFAFFLAVVLITRGRGMGLGDVKLAFLMGLVLGWPQILLALLLAFGSGAIVGVGLILANRKTLKSQIPFGPFLAASTIFTFLAGPYLINWYFNFLGL